MLNPQIKLGDLLVLVAAKCGAATSAAPALTGAVDMSKYHRVYAVIGLGDMAAETIDAVLQSDTVDTFDDSAATVVAATQLAASAAANDGKFLILECKAEDLPAGDQYLRGRVITGDAVGGIVSIAIFGVPRFSGETEDAALVEKKSA